MINGAIGVPGAADINRGVELLSGMEPRTWAGSGVSFVPIYDTIYVKPDKPTKTLAGLQLSDVRSEPMDVFNGLATVIAVGPGRQWFDESTGKFVSQPMPCKEGDRVLIWIHPKNFFKPYRGEIMMIKPDQLVAFVLGEDPASYAEEEE